MDDTLQFLVPYRWWVEAFTHIYDGKELGGYMYKAHLSQRMTEAEILLKLSRSGEEIVGKSPADFALISEGFFLRCFKWHNENKENWIYGERLESLTVRCSSDETSFGLLIRQQDNMERTFKEASSMLFTGSHVLLIWHFSSQLCVQRHPPVGGEVIFKLSIYRVSIARKTRDFRVYDGQEHSGYACGLIGLSNSGKTSHLNSVLQCIGHTDQVVHYILDFDRALDRPGIITQGVCELIRKLWMPTVTNIVSVAPATFKCMMDDYGSHDAQVFLTILMEGLIRENSLIRYLAQAEYKTTVACGGCLNVSRTPDAFSSLILPLPPPAMTINLTVLQPMGVPVPVTVTVPKLGTVHDIVKALSVMCPLGEDETYLLAEVSKNSIDNFLTSHESLEHMETKTILVAYVLPKNGENSLVIFNHQCKGRNLCVPFISRMAEANRIRDECERLLLPFTIQKENSPNNKEIEMEEQFPMSEVSVVVSWPKEDTMWQNYDISILNSLPEVGKDEVSVPLYDCLSALLADENLTPEIKRSFLPCECDLEGTSKTVDFTRLPEILVICLKRFSEDQSKQDTMVDFPIENLDLSNWMLDLSQQHYKLYATINHTGSMANGHYTACIEVREKWYVFNDESVCEVSEEQLKSACAYILFYKRKRI